MQPHRYTRNNSGYQQDSVRIKSPSFSYQGEVTKSKVKCVGKSVRVIDHCVKIKSVDDRTRAQALNHFESNLNEASGKRKSSKNYLYGGIGGTCLGVGVGAAGALFSLPVLVPTVITGLGISALGLWQIQRSRSAMQGLKNEIDLLEVQRDEWQDPADAIIQKRQEVGRRGFQYVFGNDLKNKVVHPDEVGQLWLQDFSQLLTCPQHVADVFRDDLLAQSRIDYANYDYIISHLDLPPMLFDTMLFKYAECRRAYKNFESAIKRETECLAQNYQELKEGIQHLRSKWTLPAEQMYQAGIQEAEYLYQNALAPYIQEQNLAIEQVNEAYCYVVQNPNDYEEITYKNHLETLRLQAIEQIRCDFRANQCVAAIEHSYESDRRMCYFLYNQSKMIVNSFFDQRVKLLDQMNENAQKAILEQENLGNAVFSSQLSQILKSKNEKLLSQMQISEFDVERNWHLPASAQEPLWQEVYGQIPQFQSSFGQDVTEAAWNLFWGREGLGSYSCRPVHSWNQTVVDRSLCAWRQGGFRLHQAARIPNRGIFCRRFDIPKPPDRRCPPPTDRCGREIPGSRNQDVRHAPHVQPGARIQRATNPRVPRQPVNACPRPTVRAQPTRVNRAVTQNNRVQPNTRPQGAMRTRNQGVCARPTTGGQNGNRVPVGSRR